jgi:peptide/nickel transport system substrate-binding protein
MTQRGLYLAIALSAAVLVISTAAVLASASHSAGLSAGYMSDSVEAAFQQTASPLQQAAANSPATFVRAAPGGVDSLDPHWQYDTSSAEVVQQVYEPLIFYDREATDEFVPMLAVTLPEISVDHTVYTFTIRQGVKFHEGGDLTPSDVAYTFRRWMLQDRSGGPGYLILEPMLGVYDVDDVPGSYTEICQAVKNSVTYDNDDWTVTFHLDGPFGPMMAMLASPWATVLDKEWMAANGEWTGSCDTWRDYHDPAREDSILWNQMNGTGPFEFQSWVSGELTLVRNNSYWNKEPLWEGGPSGLAGLLQIVFKYEDDAATRLDMLDTGEADSAYVPREWVTDVNELVRDEYDGGEIDPGKLTILNAEGNLRSFKNLPSKSAVDAFFTFDIDDSSPYIGSGALDGDGIPTDFFTDTHVRKAFNYCFDWDEYIAQAYGGEAEQRRGPIPRGVMGYTTTQEVYTHSPTLCEDEFKLAWGGQVWSNGFSMTIAYNTGNEQRQKGAEIIKENVESITDTFHITVTDLESSGYWHAVTGSQLPVFLGGWTEDYHHPYNWVFPYMRSWGFYPQSQNLPQALYDEYDAKIASCLELLKGSEAEQCYQELQDMAYDDALDIFMAQPLTRHYEQLWVNGYYYNPAYQGPYYFYAISEGERSYVPLTLKRYQ